MGNNEASSSGARMTAPQWDKFIAERLLPLVANLLHQSAPTGRKLESAGLSVSRDRWGAINIVSAYGRTDLLWVERVVVALRRRYPSYGIQLAVNEKGNASFLRRAPDLSGERVKIDTSSEETMRSGVAAALRRLIAHSNLRFEVKLLPKRD